MSIDSEFDVQWFPIHSTWLLQGDRRYDAGFYSKDFIAAQVKIDNLQKYGVTIKKVEDFFTKIFWPGRFKRKYTTVTQGLSFLTPSEVFMFVPETHKKVSGYPKEVLLKKDWILITRSGTIGKVIISTRILESFIVSDDLIRLVPKRSDDLYYVYAYLCSSLGQAFLARDQYGSTIRHIEPEYVERISIPIFNNEKEIIIKVVKKIYALRQKAQDLIMGAEEKFYSLLNIDKNKIVDVKYLRIKNSEIVKAFTIKSTDLSVRLDASYHEPLVSNCRKYIDTNSIRKDKFGNLRKRIFIPTRFKRTYVNDGGNGIKFIQGSHLPQMKVVDYKYLWKKTKNIDRITLDKNWLLMTRSGTVGRVSIVGKSWIGCGASEHVLRIVVDNNMVDPGYLLVFLRSLLGQIQIKGIIYGAVVDEIGEQDTSLIDELKIILPSDKIQKEIGSLAIEAYNLKEEADEKEREIIEYFEKLISKYSKE